VPADFIPEHGKIKGVKAMRIAMLHVYIQKPLQPLLKTFVCLLKSK